MKFNQLTKVWCFKTQIYDELGFKLGAIKNRSVCLTCEKLNTLRLYIQTRCKLILYDF